MEDAHVTDFNTLIKKLDEITAICQVLNYAVQDLQKRVGTLEEENYSKEG